MSQIITRPYYETTVPELQREYDRTDRETVNLFMNAVAQLRELSNLRPGSTHCDFNGMRYDALKRTAMQLASDLERAVNNSGFAR